LTRHLVFARLPPFFSFSFLKIFFFQKKSETKETRGEKKGINIQKSDSYERFKIRFKIRFNFCCFPFCKQAGYLFHGFKRWFCFCIIFVSEPFQKVETNLNT